MSLLHKVVSHGRVKQLRLLLKMPGEKVNVRDEKGRTPLHLCAMIDDEDLALKMMGMLMNHQSCDHDARDDAGRNVITHAIIKGREKIVSMLAGEQWSVAIEVIDLSGQSHLHHAVNTGNREILSLMIHEIQRNNLTVDPRNRDGVTPLSLAVQLGHFDCANILLVEGGANPLLTDPVHFRSAADWARVQTARWRRKDEEARQQQQLLTRAKSEHRMTMRRRPTAAPPRSALTARTPGLPLLTTRVRGGEYSSVTEQVNQLNLLNFNLHIATSRGKPMSQSARGDAPPTDDAPIRSRQGGGERDLVKMYQLLQQQMQIQQHRSQPLLPVHCRPRPQIVAQN